MKRNQLLALIQANNRKKTATRNLVVKNEGDSATIYVYDVIGEDWYGGVDSGEFVRELAALDVSEIHLRVDSPGGDVFAARAMQTALAEHKARVIAHIDGLAASAATFLVMGADEIRMTGGGFFMIHKGWTFTAGNADDMRKEAALLDKVDGSIAADYAARTGKDKDELIDLMAAETWYTAAEAQEAGFIDEVVEVVRDKAAKNARLYDLSAYRNAPADYSEQAAPEPEPEQPKQPDPAAHRAHIERAARLLNI